MSDPLIDYFSPAVDLPPLFPSPFSHTPHPVARQAAGLLQQRLMRSPGWSHDFESIDGGKMFGVLVVRDGGGRVGYLSAYSGMVAGRWQWPAFVPPVFDQRQREGVLSEGEARLTAMARQIEVIEQAEERQHLLSKIELLRTQEEEALARLRTHHAERRARRHKLRSQAPEDRILVERLNRESQADKKQWRQLKATWQEKISALSRSLARLDDEIALLKRQRAKLSNRLQQQLFDGYRLSNALAEQRSLRELFEQGRVPGGAGDCAGPKLLHYAQRQGLQPIALAEFWWGASPAEGVRHHGHFYPACRGKCRPILSFMLRGLPQEAPPSLGQGIAPQALETVFEDEHLVVVNKPHGLLSVPGKEVEDSVLLRLRQRYPEASGPLLVHRLDLSTSGLLLAAKQASTHKALQQQFIHRTVEKRYVALLARRLPQAQQAGEISLPLRVDLDDRPRQQVCFDHGKPALTRWRVVAREGGLTRVHFYPVTGRTHQLRLHAAYRDGLNAPIKGDELYGDGDGRLRLHAQRLGFTHPLSGKRVVVEAETPF